MSEKFVYTSDKPSENVSYLPSPSLSPSPLHRVSQFPQTSSKSPFLVPQPSTSRQPLSEINVSIKLNQSGRNTLKIDNLVKTGVRFGLSQQEIAAMGTAAGMDFNIIDENTQDLAVDKQKVKRTKERLEKEARNKFWTNTEEVVNFMFDFKKVNDCVKIENGKRSTGKENLCVFVIYG